MKPARKTRKPQPSKRSANKRGASPRETLFAGVDVDLVRQLLEKLPLEEESLEDMVDAFLSTQPEALEEMPSAEGAHGVADLPASRGQR